MKSLKHPGCTLTDWERALRGSEDITPQVRTWGTWLFRLMLGFIWLWLISLAIYWART